jgi:hypothetical protein
VPTDYHFQKLLVFARVGRIDPTRRTISLASSKLKERLGKRAGKAMLFLPFSLSLFSISHAEASDSTLGSVLTQLLLGFFFLGLVAPFDL